jgi:membrane associated rhomboid family serine protease
MARDVTPPGYDASMAAPEQTETLVCYRHPRVETAVRCSNCERPICTDCMVFSAVGIKCPECAGQPEGVRKATTAVSRKAATGTGGLVTRALIAVNVVVFLLQVSQAGDIDGTAGEVFTRGFLYGPWVADGEWWRLVTSGFLHAGPIHVFFNMLLLWWFGRPLEEYLGRGRFLGVYAISILAGAAGALMLSPDRPTVGASGAVFGILGAGLVLERQRINVFGGSALLVVGFNLVLSFTIANISLGGHLGGLAGGALSMLVLSRFGRGHAAYGRLDARTVGGLVLVALVSVALAWARVRGLA